MVVRSVTFTDCSTVTSHYNVGARHHRPAGVFMKIVVRNDSNALRVHFVCYITELQCLALAVMCVCFSQAQWQLDI